VIREILKSQPKAKVKEIQSALQARGVKASDALVNKIKYGRKRAAGKKSRAARRDIRHGSKAEAIRGIFGELGIKTRARDIVATLAGRGITVTSAQVSTLRKKLPRRGPVASVATASVSYDHLLAAKSLAQRLGGIGVARRALDSLAKLIEN
jgi:hypothetical protein